MTLKEQVMAQALLLAGELSDQQTEILDALCCASSTALEARLRDGLTPEDCKADFIAAASLLALAALSSVEKENRTEQITAGDFSIRRQGTDAASTCLRAQAELMIAPYLKDRFSFLGV